MGTQKISVSDHVNGLQYAGGNKSDKFVIDMDSFTGRDVPSNPRISRNLSRKWSHRGSEEKTIPNSHANNIERNEKDSALPSPSPRAASGPERLAAGPIDHSSSPQIHHQITITAANIGTPGESRCVRRNSFRRASMSPWWILDPKKILFIFATLSSIGTIMLIYFTLSIGKPNNANGVDLDLQQ
ncbi:uncharacterized protein LOC116208162 isoform X2 [Punica granatum]|nr:uncharacterized protein LOC116208162 isoform X2 [Punica granatum]